MIYTPPYASKRELLYAVLESVAEVKGAIMATQDQVNQLATRVQSSTAAIRQDIADLKAANPELDLSSLESSVAGLEGLDAENPATPPAPPTP